MDGSALVGDLVLDKRGITAPQDLDLCFHAHYPLEEVHTRDRQRAERPKLTLPRILILPEQTFESFPPLGPFPPL